MGFDVSLLRGSSFEGNNVRASWLHAHFKAQLSRKQWLQLLYPRPKHLQPGNDVEVHMGLKGRYGDVGNPSVLDDPAVGPRGGLNRQASRGNSTLRGQDEGQMGHQYLSRGLSYV